jgi:ribA/ribD-fused uncharacterized protein
MKDINSFRDDFFFLSNFYLCDIIFNGLKFGSSEAAFQAQKCIDPKDQLPFTTMTPGQAKKYGRKVELRKDWEEVKVGIMRDIVKAKFDQDPILKEKLIDTGDVQLIEGNKWHDYFWGVCNGKGKNTLGIILMDLRKAYKEE